MYKVTCQLYSTQLLDEQGHPVFVGYVHNEYIIQSTAVIEGDTVYGYNMVYMWISKSMAIWDGQDI